MPLTNGQTFAGYTIIRLLGSGGMGEVYLAQHPRLPRRDALKLLPRDWSGDAEYRARFSREADLASTLWHPNIVGVHDRGEQAGQLWISMDFVDGIDAAQLLADRYPAGMPADEVARIVAAVASALDAAHKQGLLHRDVKPANIMLTHLDDDGEQRILLTDFGIARSVNDISGLTATNTTVGTVAYCAPEQLLAEEIDGRADQYALAATAYHLLTGTQLFPHSNPAVVIGRHLNTAPPALADASPELAGLDPILAAGLAKRPEDRFARCSDFARALAEQVESHSRPAPAAPTTPAPIPAARQATAIRPLSNPMGQTKGRNPWTVAAGVVGVLALFSGLLFVWRPWAPASPETSAWPSLVPATPTSVGLPVSATMSSSPATAPPSQVELPFTGLNGPEWVAVDTAGNVYITDESLQVLNPRVLKLPAGSHTQVELPFTGSGLCGLAVDTAGNVYLCGISDHDSVFELPAGSKTPVELPFTGLRGPTGVAVDTGGSVYTTDTTDTTDTGGRVIKLPAGSSTPVELPFIGLSGAAGVAVDTAGNVYVTDYEKNRVLELPKGSNAPVELPFTGLRSPTDVAVDTSGNVYIIDGDMGGTNYRVLKLPAGSKTQVELPFTGLQVPGGMAVDTAGNVYITDGDGSTSTSNRVLELPAG